MSTAEFGELIDREHDFLHQLAMKLTKRHDDAQDLIQDTYFKALKNKDKFDIGIFSAAVSDFKPKNLISGKLKKSNGLDKIDLELNNQEMKCNQVMRS